MYVRTDEFKRTKGLIMVFYGEGMTPQEIHGTQLRMVTDELEGAVDELENSSKFAIIVAEDLLADVVSARIRQQAIQG